MLDRTQLRVAIDARVHPLTSGGIAQAVLGLVTALGRLADDSTRYLIVVENDDQEAFLTEHLGENQELVRYPSHRRSLARRAPGAVTRRARRLLTAEPPQRPPTRVPLSDGFYEGLEVDVLHFPHQAFVVCGIPTIYNPHDLQHLHLPRFFTAEDLEWRETIYRAGCNYSVAVVVASQWVKDDVASNYAVDPRKIQIVPWGAPSEAYAPPSADSVARVTERYGLERRFAIYPATTWPHKNHLALFDAFARASRQGIDIDLVCTGSVHRPSWPALEDAIRRLDLSGRVHFVGFVSESDLRALYRRAEALVMPTLFESDSFPIYEAWLDDLPVACSNVTSLPDQVQDAAIVFEPTPEGIADALTRILTEPGLQATLRERGRRRLKDFDWSRTGQAYRALYRAAAGLPPTAAESELLAWDWMREPARSSRQDVGHS